MAVLATARTSLDLLKLDGEKWVGSLDVGLQIIKAGDMASKPFLGQVAFLALAIDYLVVVHVLMVENEVVLQVGPGIFKRLLVLADGDLAVRWLRSLHQRESQIETHKCLPCLSY